MALTASAEMSPKRAPPTRDARSLALDVVLRVYQDRAFLDRVLPASLERTQLIQEDKALATELATGVIRRRRWLDRCLAPHVTAGLDRLDPIVLEILRLGAYQLCVLDRIPPHAAVSTSVELAKRRRRYAAGLVNAVLRRVAEAARPAKPTSTSDLAAWASLPDWLASELQRRLTAAVVLDPRMRRYASETPPTIEELLSSLAAPPRPTLRVLENRISRENLLAQLLATGVRAWACDVSSHGLVIDRAGELDGLAGFGHDYIAQDEAAQLVCELARSESDPTLDGCAAPGGKTLALWSMGHTSFTAVDVHENRTQLLGRALAKAQVSGTVLCADMQSPPFAPGTFGTVMVDVPCSGSGTLRRHPELRWSLTSESTTALEDVQARILSAASELVRPGGCLLYAVCSFFEQEGAERIRSFLATTKSFALEAWVDTSDRMHVMDGFFAAKLRRQS